MKLIIKDKHKAYLKCKYKKDKDRVFMVEIKDLMSWYPLNLAYDLKVDRTADNLELCRLTSTLPKHYGDDGSSFIVSKISVDDTFYFEEVKKENTRIMNKAKEYNLVTIEEDYTLEDVTTNFAKLRLIFEEVNSIVVERYIKTLSEELKVEFILKHQDTQVDEALRHSSTDLDRAYDELGQIYNMCVIMKKATAIDNSISLKDCLEGLKYSLKE